MAEEHDQAEANDEKATEDTKPAKGYGKRPMWQLVLIYVVVAAIAYGAVYLIFFNGSSTGY